MVIVINSVIGGLSWQHVIWLADVTVQFQVSSFSPLSDYNPTINKWKNKPVNAPIKFEEIVTVMIKTYINLLFMIFVGVVVSVLLIPSIIAVFTGLLSWSQKLQCIILKKSLKQDLDKCVCTRWFLQNVLKVRSKDLCKYKHFYWMRWSKRFSVRGHKSWLSGWAINICWCQRQIMVTILWWPSSIIKQSLH